MNQKNKLILLGVALVLLINGQSFAGVGDPIPCDDGFRFLDPHEAHDRDHSIETALADFESALQAHTVTEEIVPYVPLHLEELPVPVALAPVVAPIIAQPTNHYASKSAPFRYAPSDEELFQRHPNIRSALESGHTDAIYLTILKDLEANPTKENIERAYAGSYVAARGNVSHSEVKQSIAQRLPEIMSHDEMEDLVAGGGTLNMPIEHVVWLANTHLVHSAKVDAYIQRLVANSPYGNSWHGLAQNASAERARLKFSGSTVGAQPAPTFTTSEPVQAPRPNYNAEEREWSSWQAQSAARGDSWEAGRAAQQVQRVRDAREEAARKSNEQQLADWRKSLRR